MLPARTPPPPKRKPLKVSKTPRTRLHVAGVARALDLTEAQVRTRVQRKQWDLIPEPEAERSPFPGGGRYFWYADKVEAFKAATET